MATFPSADTSAANPLLHALMYTMHAGIRDDTADLATRQLAVFLKRLRQPSDGDISNQHVVGWVNDDPI
jgi:hypothetical protein